jgi:N-acetylneuraminic acid mutarotase
MIYLLSFLTINMFPSYSWQSLPSPGIKTYAHAVVYDPNNDLFFITGGDSTGLLTTNMDICLQFDPKTNTWDTKEPMYTAKRGHAASYRNGFMHVLCGIDNYGNRIAYHEVYDINSDSWDLAAPAPIPVSNPGLVTWKDSLIYIMGGYDTYHDARTEVYYYNPETNSWNSATSLPRPFHCGGAQIKGDSIYIVGGGDGGLLYSNILVGEINPLDPTEIDWSWGDPLPIENFINSLAIKNNKLYMIGGAFDDGTNQVWEYDIPGETWTQLPDYPTNIIMRGDADRRDKPDSAGVVYCFMGDTSYYSSFNPTDECFRLVVTVNDAGMYAINSPVSDTMIESFVQVNGTVKNYGINTYSFKTYVNIYDPDLLTAFSDSIQVDDLAPLDTLNIDFGSFQLTKNGTYTVEMFTYAVDDKNSSNDSLTTTFNSSEWYWQSLPSPGIKTYAHAVVYDPNNDLFFITGGDSTGLLTTNMDICLQFDPKTNTWDTKEPMYTAKRGHAASYRNGFMHVLCGIDNYGNRIAYHEVYDINSDSWDLAAPAPIPVSNPGLVTWKDSLIYIMGGYDTYHDARTEVYYYNPETNSWNSATSLPRPFHCGGAQIKGDSIYIVGGGDGGLLYSNILVGEINPLDPTEIDWSWGDPLPIENFINSLAIKNNKLYMIGGAFDDGTNQVWEYDIPGETWTQLPDYPTNIIMRGDADRRDKPDSAGVVYCFMGDTSYYSSFNPTDECFRLTRAPFSGIDEEEKLEKNSVSLNSTINLAGEIAINCNIRERCDLKIYMYDVLGRQVFSHLEKNIASGSHQFTINKDFKNGIYFIRIEAGPTVENTKVILIR